MTPSSLSVPTDNIYKFACLFGLALIISSVFSFVAVYTSTLDQKVKHLEVIITLEAKTQRTKAEDEVLSMHRRLIDVSKSNEDAAGFLIGVLLTFGGGLSLYGARKWNSEIQSRDDRLAKLQIEKLEAEIAKLRADISSGN